MHRSQKNLLNNGWTFTMVLALRHWRKAHWNTSRWLWKHLNILLLTVVMKPNFPVLKNISSTGFGPLQPFQAKFKLYSASCCALNVTVHSQSRCAVLALCLYAFQSAIITIIQVILNIMYKCNKKKTNEEAWNPSHNKRRRIYQLLVVDKVQFWANLVFHKHLQSIFF